MRVCKFPFILLISFVAVCSISLTPAKKEKTTVYIVRHAEKDISDPKHNDPELTEAGRARAKALAKELRSEKFSAIFSTQYKRTMNTVAPLARKFDLPIGFYDPKDPKAIAARVKSNYGGKKIIIAGHSNTVLDLIEAFGVKRPVAELTEEDYDLLFKLTLKGDDTELSVKRFGASHHITELELR